MNKKLHIALFLSFIAFASYAQQQQPTTTIKGYIVPVCVYKGDTIPAMQLPNVYIFKPLKFKSEKERREYYRLVRNVKKTLPLAAPSTVLSSKHTNTWKPCPTRSPETDI